MKAERSMIGRLFFGIFVFSLYQLWAFDVVQPRQKALFAEEFATVVVNVSDPLITDVGIVNGDDNYDIALIEGKDVYCKTIRLNVGVNNIMIFAYDGDGIKEENGVTVYYTSPVSPKHKYPPSEYKQNFFHTDKKEKLCMQCHDMSVNEVPGVAFENVKDSNCYDCHKELVLRENDHAPAVNWLCTSCHDGETGKRSAKTSGMTKYTFVDPIGPVCFKCHKKNKNLWAQKRFHHDPADAGRCNRCHNPHSSKNEFYLRKSTWDICVGCHADKVAGMHVTNTSFRDTDHPTHNKPDPSRPGKQLSCVSCHNPHGSNKRYFLPDNRGNKPICTMCHKK